MLNENKIQILTEVITKTPDCEIESSRIFSANRELVFRAWSEPNHLKIGGVPPGLQIPSMNLTFGWVANGALLCTDQTREIT